MPVSIHSTIPSRLFQGIGQVYLAGRMIALVNAEGGILIEGAGPDIAPTITRAPSILPAGAAIGDSITLDIGAAEGSSQTVATWDIMLNGDSIRDRLDAGAPTLELTQPGYYELTVSWANSAGIVEAETAALTVEVAPEVPSIDYAQAIAYIDAGTPFEGDASNVTAIISAGQQGLAFAATGSGDPVTHGAEGFSFSGGAYLQSANLSGQPTGDGVFAVVDITLAGYGASTGQILQGGGGRINILDTGGTLRVQGTEDSSVNMTAGVTPYGTRVVLGGRLDDLLDVLGMYDLAGSYSERPIDSTDPNLTRIITGRYIVGTLHRLAVFGRPEGGAWPASFEEVYADFQAGA